jgi:hypothetical protein
VRVRGREGKSKEFVEGYNVFGKGRLMGIGWVRGIWERGDGAGRRCLDGV